jgi:hypothetical protein
MLVAAVILATVALGWMGVVFVGVLFAAVDGLDSAAAESGASAAVGWMLILLVTGMTAGARPLGVIGSALGVPMLALPLVSLLFAAGLAWSSAATTSFIRRVALSAREGRPLPEADHR